ncbi:MAG TPA: site-specific DNA-methyltransferase [Bacteroidales bacterium]|nr:site-specific DNA-methyltransferase [Bacteroidales bacterium]
MNGQSLSPLTEKLKLLQQIIPEAFTEDKIDWEKLRTTLGEDINFANERYVLNWAGKSDAFRLMQQPTSRTLIPVRDESINFDETENIFIEGDNLDVLKILQKSYFGKIKMIYIDPPYNTGNDSFIYSDRFAENKTEYQKRVGDKDDKGYVTNEGVYWKNSRENGQYHSNWLNMMMPRLYLARTLLKDDGVIFVSIDDNEVHNLRLLMNEIFGEENFVSQIAWRRTDNQPNIGLTARVKEYILIFAKNYAELTLGRLPLSESALKEYRYEDECGAKFRRGILLHKTRGRHYYTVTTKSGNILNGPWMISEEKFKELDENKGIYWTSGGDEQPYSKIYLKDSKGAIPNDFWGIEYGTNQRASLEVEALFNKRYFDFPKPVSLIKTLINVGIIDDNDIVLDFFAGSGTTAHAVMQLNKEDDGNRKYILVQMPEPCDEKSEAFKAGYKTIADIAKERIRRAGKKIQSEIEAESKKKEAELNFDNAENRPLEIDTGFKVFHLSESNFKEWRQPEAYTTEALAEQLKLFIDPVAENANLQNMVYELLLKSGKDLNVNIETCNGYHLIEGNELAFILEKVDEQIITEVLTKQPKKVIALDRIFKGNDQLKTNTALQMKDAGVEFKTI